MNKAQITKIIQRTQENPDFFHKLVFEPVKAVNEIRNKRFDEKGFFTSSKNNENINYPLILETTNDFTLLYVNQVLTDPALVLTSLYSESMKDKKCGSRTCACTTSNTGCPGNTCGLPTSSYMPQFIS